MIGSKGLKGAALASLLLAIAGCGQPYTPGPDKHEAGPREAGDVFSGDPDAAPYQTVSYDVLRSWLVDTLRMPQTAVTSGICDPAVVDPTECPLQAPVQYLDANKGALGLPIFTADPAGTQGASMMTSGGFKVWIVAASSACGLAMQNPSTVEELFPAAQGGISSYDQFFTAFLARSPTDAENVELDLLQASYPDDLRKSTSVCTTILSSLENLAAN